MTANQAVFPLQTMARVLGVSRSGFHAWSARPPSKRALADAQLSERIAQIHLASRETYGVPRIHAELADEGTQVGRKRVERLMKLKALVGVSRRKGPRTTIRDVRLRPASDLVDRNFSAERPNQLWVADITYVLTWVGFLYLAVVLDAFSRRIVGWAMGHDLKAQLVIDAMNMAIGQRRPRDVIHHSDQGSQGGLNRSSQRIMDGGCDGETEAWCGSTAEGTATVPRPAWGGEAGGPAAVLACNCSGAFERGCGPGWRCIPSGGIAVVPGGGRNATITSGVNGAAAVGTIPVVRGARGDRAAERPGARRAGDRPADRASGLDGLAGIAP